MNKNVLVLEDNKNTREHIRTIIEEGGMNCKVWVTGNMVEAYGIALSKKISVFIVDIILDTRRPGDLSGLCFIEQIRKNWEYAFIPVIVITSLEDPKMYSYQKLHCYGYIEKPFEEEQLKELVKNALCFPQRAAVEKTLYFRKEGIIYAVERTDIVYVESINHMLHIHVKSGDVLKIPYITLKKVLDEVNSADIIQCSRNMLVNKSFIANADITNRFIQLRYNLGKVEIGLTYKNHVKEALQWIS